MDNSQIRLDKARREWEKALDAITQLTRADSDRTIHEAMEYERVMWRKLDAARREYIAAHTESIGR
jgi:hypothetical protein